MTTLHTLRRTYALTFSELAMVTGVSTRDLAAFEYHGYPLSASERHAVAAFFGIADSALEGGFVTRHAAEPTLPFSRAQTLVFMAAAMTITWGLQTAHADEHDPLHSPLAASFNVASAYVAEAQSAIALPSPIADSFGVATGLWNQDATAQEQNPAAPPATGSEQPPPEAAEASTTAPEAPAANVTAAPTDVPAASTPLPAQPPAPNVETDGPAAINVPIAPGLPPGISLPTAVSSVPTPPSSAPTPTAVTQAKIRDAYENNYDFDHAPVIPVSVPVTKLNFVCPDDDDCADNDFFQVPLTGGQCYRVATSDLSPGIDTNVIVYGPERNRKPPLGGNDNVSPGELRSQVDVCVPGRGAKTGFVLVGNHDNQRPPEPMGERTYTLQVTQIESPPAKLGEPHRCPLVPARGSVIVVQGWGVGTHAPASQWGGVDLMVQGGPTAGTPIVATHAGRVQVFLNSWPGGNYVSITSDAGWRTAYAHLNTVLVGSGDYVTAGTIIGTVGQTGWATGPHLHYETWNHGVNVDPAPILFCD